MGSAAKVMTEERRREVRLRRSNLIDDLDGCSITFKVAQTTEEIEQAYELVWGSYVAAGLQADNGEGIRFTKYHLLPSTRVLIAVCRPELDKEKPDYEKLKEPGLVVGTLTVVMDTPMGLPMEDICGNNVKELREEGHRLVEVTSLAINPEYRKHNIAMYLYKLMFQFVRHKNATDVACSVTKKHLSFYRRMLLFKPIGEIKKYAAANQLETQCHLLNIPTAEKAAEEIYHSRHFDADLFAFFFTDTPGVNRLKGEGQGLSAEQLEYFLYKRTRYGDSLHEKTRCLLREEYQKLSSSFPF